MEVNATSVARVTAAVNTVAISSAEAERGFSTMNLVSSDLRSRLKTQTSLVGPELSLWDPLPFVKKWLRGSIELQKRRFVFSVDCAGDIRMTSVSDDEVALQASDLEDNEAFEEDLISGGDQTSAHSAHDPLGLEPFSNSNCDTDGIRPAATAIAAATYVGSNDTGTGDSSTSAHPTALKDWMNAQATAEVGPALHSDIAEFLTGIANKPPTRSFFLDLMKDYPSPANAPFLASPKTNPEILQKVTSRALKTLDNALSSAQQAGCCMAIANAQYISRLATEGQLQTSQQLEAITPLLDVKAVGEIKWLAEHASDFRPLHPNFNTVLSLRVHASLIAWGAHIDDQPHSYSARSSHLGEDTSPSVITSQQQTVSPENNFTGLRSFWDYICRHHETDIDLANLEVYNPFIRVFG
ncbi:unnamed protein product [Cyprideis torosa]|uniref:Uncharacterized protein n=1 Tax=Cyprideis torosa TaxID=163714 RepID=A0A7R8WBH8_9CRUS|nr:unnamed protein product [Cyprideis torosa]CAG0886933.1 unnamed protein product [Cyprideis torosa]